MAYREVTMIEIKEVLRRWVSRTPKKRIAAQLGLDPKTVRRYVEAAEQHGVRLEDGLAGLTDERVGAVIVALKQPPAHPHGDPWWTRKKNRWWRGSSAPRGSWPDVRPSSSRYRPATLSG